MVSLLRAGSVGRCAQRCPEPRDILVLLRHDFLVRTEIIERLTASAASRMGQDTSPLL